MRVRIATLVLLLVACVGTARSEVLDRIVAVVNSKPITYSDLDEEMRFEALENARSLQSLTATDRDQAFDHLVQYRLLQDQMQGSAPATKEEIQKRLQDICAAHKQADDSAAWANTLRAYGFSSEKVQSLVTKQVEQMKFVEFRVRPLVRVTRAEVNEYYEKTLVPQVRAMGEQPEPVETLTQRIRELLVEQKMDKEFEKWMQGLRSQAQIQVLWKDLNAANKSARGIPAS